jgi:hypothetical protein
MNAVESALVYLKRLGEHISSEDNLCTQDPIYVVKQKTRIFGIDPDYHTDGYIWHDGTTSEEPDSDVAAMLDLVPEEKVPSRYEKRYYRLQDEWVQPCLTRIAAENYIQQNAHNLTDPFIYAESAYRNHQLIGLRKIALDLYREEAQQ